MRHTNIRTVVAFEAARALKSKAFWIGALLGPLVLCIVMGISASTSSRAASDDDTASIPQKIEYLDDSGLLASSPAAASLTQVSSVDKGKQDVIDGSVDAFLYFPKDLSTSKVEVYAQDLGIMKSQAYSSIATSLLAQAAVAKINDPTLVTILTSGASVTLTTYKDGQETPGVAGLIPPLIFLLLFYLVIVVQGNRMLTSSLEEKQNRVTEMILTTIPSEALMAGKVVSLVIIGVVQMAVTIVPMLVAVFIMQRTGTLGSLDFSNLVFEPGAMAVGALYLVLGFLLFTASLMAIGAAVPTVQDAQGLFSAVIILLMAPLFVLPVLLTNPSSPIVTVMTIFPWTAPVAGMACNAMGSLPVAQAIIGLVLIAAMTVVTFLLGARLFRYGSVEYSKKLDLKAVLRKTKV